MRPLGLREVTFLRSERTGGPLQISGGGKSLMLAFALRQLMGAQRRNRALSQRVRAAETSGDLAGKLAAAAETDNAISCITSSYAASSLCMDVSPYYQPLPNLLDELRAAKAASAVEVTLWAQTVRLLSLPRCAELSNGEPPTDCSPCGVIRLAAPRLPRAPGRPANSPVPSSSVVVAA